MTVFHNLCRDYHEITAPPLDCVCTVWLFAHDLPSRHKREDFIITTQTAVSTMLGQVFTQTGLIVLPSHQQHLQLLRLQATPVPPASAGPSLLQIHTSSIRIPRSSVDLGYPAWCSNSFHLTSPRSILVGLLLLTASSEMEIPDGTPDNTVKIAMTLPTEIQNQPFVSHTFPFQIDTRLSLAASTSKKLAATIRKPQLSEFSGGRSGESIFFDSKSASLCSSGRLADTNEPRYLPTTDAATKNPQRHATLPNIFCRDALILRSRQRHNLLCRRRRLKQITTKINPRARCFSPSSSPSQHAFVTTLTSHCLS